MSGRVIGALVGVFVMGAVIGLLVALALNDSTDPSDAEPAPPTVEECAEATAVVDAAEARIEEIGSLEASQDASFFAALLVEQRTVTFAMEDQPACFTLDERAGAQGLLEGIEGLLAQAGSQPVSPLADVPISDSPPDSEPSD